MSEQRPIVPWQAQELPASPTDIAAFDGGAIGIEPGSVYRPASNRALAAVVLLGLNIGLYLVDIAWSIYGIVLLSDLTHVTNEQIDSYDRTLVVIGYATFGLFALTAIAFLIWLHRATANVPALGGGKTDHTPNGAVGWWFVPFANLVKPYFIVADVWRRLATSAANEGAGPVMAWWVAYVAGNVLSRIYSVLPPATSIEAFNGQATFNVVIDLVVILAAVLAILVVRGIQRRSTRRAEAIAATPTLAVAPVEAADSTVPPESTGAERPTEADAPASQ